ncbi:MAG: polyprenyl synthetase family protein [Caldilineales bacterium]
MLSSFFSRYLPLINAEMRRAIGDETMLYAGHYGMLRYHMGWLDQAFAPVNISTGKRIRPLVCLLACEALHGDPAAALPAAAALELVHNFSLIHDDVEDDSPLRHHRATVWALWGVPQAINAGDALFTLARLALQRLPDTLPASVQLAAYAVFDRACLRLTEGQYLDMSFEQRLDVSVDEYLAMIGGKTAALLSASVEMGALLSGTDATARSHLTEFGYNLGVAFQIQDDILGIWGDEEVTGKSAASDILTRKKSLPVAHALHHPAVATAMRARYAQPITSADVPAVLALLEEAGSQAYARAQTEAAHSAALAALQRSGVVVADNPAGLALLELAETLLRRDR